MADNTVLNSGSGGDTIATDDIGGVKFQRVKVVIGADGSNDGDVSSSNALPVAGPVSLTGSGCVAISGSVTVADGSVVSLSSNPTVAISGGDVSLTGSTSVVVSGPVSLAGSIQVSGIGSAVSLTNTVSVIIVNTPTVEVGGDVSLTGSVSVVVSSGSVTVSGVVSLTGSMSVLATGAAAHDAAVAGNPLLQGLEARTTNPTAVGDGDAVRAMADDMGRQVVMPGGPRDLVVSNHVSLSVSTTVTLLAAQGAGVFSDLLALTISNPSATDATVTIFDDITTGVQTFKWELAANGGGIVMVFNTPFKNATANTGWGITSSETGVTATVQALNTV